LKSIFTRSGDSIRSRSALGEIGSAWLFDPAARGRDISNDLSAQHDRIEPGLAVLESEAGAEDLAPTSLGDDGEIVGVRALAELLGCSIVTTDIAARHDPDFPATRNGPFLSNWRFSVPEVLAYLKARREGSSDNRS
jgi:hypothetical protein